MVVLKKIQKPVTDVRVANSIFYCMGTTVYMVWVQSTVIAYIYMA